MHRYSIRVSWSEEDGMFVAVCPALGDLSALGDSAHTAAAELEQAVELALETYEAEGWPIPEPDILEKHSGQFRLRLPRSLHGRLAHKAECEGVSLNTLAVGLLAESMGSADTQTALADRLDSTIVSLEARLLSSVYSVMFELAADSSTSGDRDTRPFDYDHDARQTSDALRLVN